MPFVKLNNWTVAVTKCVKVYQEIGSRLRNFNGGELRDRRGIKELFKLTTAPLRQGAAAALVGLLLGLGDTYLDSTTSTLSSKGAVPLAEEITWLAQYLASGQTVADTLPGELPFHQSTGRLQAKAVEPASENLLPADSRDAENAPTGYTAYSGAALSGNTSYFWQGSKSLRVVTTDSAIQGAYANFSPGGGSSGKTYIGSLYYRTIAALGGVGFQFTLYDATNTARTAVLALDNNDGKWHRAYVVITLGADSTDLRLEARSLYAVNDIYLDGWQIEEQPASWPQWPTSWYDGDRADDGELSYPPSLLQGAEAITVSILTGAPNKSPIADSTLFKFTASPAQLFHLYRPSGTDNLVFRTVDTYGLDDTSITATSIWGDEWALITAILRPSPEDDEFAMELWVDGVLEATAASVGNTYGVTDAQSLEMGHASGANHWLGYIGYTIINPYAWTAEMVASLSAYFGYSSTPGATPAIAVAGNVTARGNLQAKGRVVNERNLQGYKDATWRNNLRTIDFELREV